MKLSSLTKQFTFGKICNINAIYNIFPMVNGDMNPSPKNSSQADKYLTNMAVTDPTKEKTQADKQFTILRLETL